MRILAVRGENLASLPQFDVRFDEGPQAPGHVVAVVGPTGSGKSTLLDAICLALYDAAPRVTGAAKVSVDDYQAHGADPCALLRRGTGSGFAEVDFEGRDGLVYRSRWEVWRARKKADGKLQPQRLILTSLADGRELSGATKTETLEAIADKVGLSFEEFSRAVLLAQGAFSAFLDATGDARAELLERMTRTEVYAELSKRAHQRARESEGELLRRETEATAVPVLEQQQREELDALLKLAESQRDAALGERDTARNHAHWYETLQTLQQELAEAQIQLAQATAEQESTKQLREQLERAAAAETLRAPFERWAAAEEAATLASQQLAASARALSAGREALDSARNEQAAAAADRQAHGQRRGELEQQLDEAKNLDHQLASLKQAIATAKSAYQRATEEHGETHKRRQALSDTLEEAEDRQRGLKHWLESHPAEATAAPRWPRWEKELEELAAHQLRLAELASTTLADAHQTAVQDRLRCAEDQHHRARTQLEAVAAKQEALDQEDHAASGPDTGELRELGERLGELCARAEQLSGIDNRFRRSHRRRNEAARNVLTHTEACQLGQQQVDESKRTLSVARAELAEVQASLQRHQTRQGLATRSEELLSPGHPCPLCGSAEHKLEQRPPVASAKPLRDAVETQTAKHHSAEEAFTQTSSLLGQHQRALEEAHGQQRGHERDAAEHLQAWSDAVGALSMSWVDAPKLTLFGADRAARVLPAEPRRSRATTEIDEAVSILRAAQTEVRRLAQLREQRAAARQALHAQQAELRHGVDAAESAHKQAFDAVGALQASQRAAKDETERTQEQAAKIRKQLRPPLKRWEEADAALDTSAAAFLDEARRRVDVYLAKEEEQLEIKQQAERIAHELGLLKEVEEQQRVAAIQTGAQCTQLQTEQAALHGTRAGVLNGRQVEDVRREEQSRQKQCDDREQRAQSGLASIERDTAAAEERKLLSQQNSEATALVHERCLKALQDELRSSSFESPEALNTVLGLDRQWLEQARAAEDARRELVAQCTTRAEDRRQRHQLHRDTEVPPIDAEQATNALEASEAALIMKVETEARLKEAQRQDDVGRERQAKLQARVLGQRPDTEAWAELSALIGSSDGKKLRAFAQGLTLEILVEQANHHLRSLRPRYTLERAKQTMDLVVVDHDLGDELRPISTLSGGERFLLSLALALGLSSLSSRHVHLGSLFIDEGFGALDSGALDVALSVLDELQAEGRTVVVISHVAELAERIVDKIEVQPKGPGTSRVLGAHSEFDLRPSRSTR